MSNNANPLVSVILPVWNPGQEISRCIESLRNQTLTEIEMIFVDDCGTDTSMDKVFTAAAEDSRIRIIKNEKNIGAGPSRNRGIDAASGKYLSFIDPDDYIETDFLEKLYAEACKEMFDIVKGSEKREKDGVVISEARNLNPVIRNGLAAGKPLYTLFTYEHQSAIYRREMIITGNVRYGFSSRAQDTTFQLKACSHAKSFSMVDSAYYYFCERNDSAMHIADAKLLNGYLHSVHEKIDYLLMNLLYESGIQDYLRKLFLDALREYERYTDIPTLEEETQDYLFELRNELLRIPFCDDLVQNSYSLHVLMDDAEGLPMIPYYSPWEGSNPPIRYAKLAKRWIDYYLNNPKDPKACKIQLTRICINATRSVRGHPTTTFSSEELIQGAYLLKTQLQRLPLKARLYIVICAQMKDTISLLKKTRCYRNVDISWTE